MTVTTEARPERRAATRTRSKFFVTAAVIMLAIVFAGFAPTFYLRAVFEPMDKSGSPNLPLHLVLHGFILSAWFLLFFAQTSLVAVGRTDIHRMLGVVGIILIPAVIGISAFTSISAIPRSRAAGEDMAGVYAVVSGNFLSLLTFAVLTGLAVYFRRRPLMHKPMMLLACVAIIGPAFSGRRAFGEFLKSVLPAFGTTWYTAPTVWLVALALLALVSHDMGAHRRVTPGTKWGALIIVAYVVVQESLNRTGVGPAFVARLAA